MPNYLARVVSAGARTTAPATPPRAAPPIVPAASPFAAFAPDAASMFPPIAPAGDLMAEARAAETGASPPARAAEARDLASPAPPAATGAPARPRRQEPPERDSAVIQAPRALRPDVPPAEQLDRPLPGPPANAGDRPRTIGARRTTVVPSVAPGPAAPATPPASAPPSTESSPARAARIPSWAAPPIAPAAAPRPPDRASAPPSAESDLATLDGEPATSPEHESRAAQIPANGTPHQVVAQSAAIPPATVATRLPLPDITPERDRQPDPQPIATPPAGAGLPWSGKPLNPPGPAGPRQARVTIGQLEVQVHNHPPPAAGPPAPAAGAPSNDTNDTSGLSQIDRFRLKPW